MLISVTAQYSIRLLETLLAVFADVQPSQLTQLCIERKCITYKSKALIKMN